MSEFYPEDFNSERDEHLRELFLGEHDTGPNADLYAGELIEIPPKFADDLAYFKVHSDKWIQYQIEESAHTDAGDYMHLFNTDRHALSQDLCIHAALREYGAAVSIEIPSANKDEEKPGLEHDLEIRVAADRLETYRWVHGKVRDRIKVPFWQDPVLIPEGSTPYMRLAGTIGSIMGLDEIPPMALLEGSRQRLFYRDLLRELSDEEFATLLPRAYMTAVLSRCLASPYILVRPSKEAELKVKWYEKLAEARARPLNIEQFHGIINAAIRSVFDDWPETKGLLGIK